MSDQRFAALSTDPRYRLPNRRVSRAAVDPRFKRQFTDDDFLKKAEVDRYGRKIKPQRRRDVGEGDKGETGGVLKREVVGSSDDSGEDEDLEAKPQSRDPAREGGFSESESEEESTSDEGESDGEADLAEDTAGHEQTESIPMGEVSRRIAAVNLDWDNVRAIDIMAVASSFLPKNGSIDSISIYPSEFGRERLEREELEGPPREIFASSKRKDEEDEAEESDEEGEDKKIERRLQQDQVDDGNEFDTAKLRQYQLERLRYYYAVIACSSNATAKSLYDSMDGREYLSSANFFDLRFIPDEVSFEDDKPTDECRKLPDGYTPNEFRTEALTHSKVRLTWDDDDTTRKEVQKRAFSRAEMDENDLKAYIGTDSSDAESVSSWKSAAEDRKMKKRDAQRQKMRAALGLAESSAQSGKDKSNGKDNVVGDMQITFTSGLAREDDGDKSIFENEPQDEESTRQRYIRKERERKQKRKEKMKAARGEAAAQDAAADVEVDVEDDKGFDDPFFTDPAAAAVVEKRAKKAEKAKKLAAQAARDEEAASRRAELDLLMADEKADAANHFDMREIEKAEKAARRKGKKKDKKSMTNDVSGAQEDAFQIETEDPRFKALFDSHEFAIDPTNPRFKKTKGMNELLAEGRKKRKGEDFDDGDKDERVNKKQREQIGKDGDLSGLVKRLKGGGKSKR